MCAWVLANETWVMIEVKSLTKTYGATTAVDDLSFTVPDGAVTGFLGPNGAGKSTTMRCLLGLNSPARGMCLVDGRPFHQHLHPVRVAGAVLDASWYHPGRTGRGHLQVVAASGGLASSRVDEVLDAVGLVPAADRQVRGYSLGMKQRLGLATALLGDPSNLILDEPVNGLDPEGVHWMRQVLRQAAADGKAVLVSSHLLSEMQIVADRLVVVGRGRLISEWGMDEFLQRSSRRCVIHTTDDARLLVSLAQRGVATEARASGLTVTFNHVLPDAFEVSTLCHELDVLVIELRDDITSLEDVFLEMTDASSEYRSQN